MRALPPSLCLLLALAACGCEGLFPSKVSLPAYLRIAPFTLNTESGQGSRSAAITEVWVRVNGDFLGVYKLPAVVPVLADGPSEIILDAGVRENGIATTPEIYPFYQSIQRTETLGPGSELAFNPATAYRSGTRFAMLEGFENSGHLFQQLVSGDPANRIQINRQTPFEGGASAVILLDSLRPSAELATTARFSGMLDRGAYVFLELNYQSEVPVSFGFLATSRGNGSQRIQYVAGFNPNETWKKIYFNLSPAVSGSVSEEYQVILKAAIPLRADGTLSRKNAKIQLDNLKLVHF